MSCTMVELSESRLELALELEERVMIGSENETEG